MSFWYCQSPDCARGLSAVTFLIRNLQSSKGLNFSIGIYDVLFEVNDKKFSSLICFESTFPEINRRHADMGADFFVYFSLF